MDEGERVTLRQLSDELGISYEGVRKSFWNKVKMGTIIGHYEKILNKILLDEYGADMIRASRRPTVVVQDGSDERIAELSAEVESLRAKLAESASEMASAYKALAEERGRVAELLTKNNELEIKLLTVTPAVEPVADDPGEAPAQPEEQGEPKRAGWFKRLFGL